MHMAGTNRTVTTRMGTFMLCCLAGLAGVHGGGPASAQEAPTVRVHTGVLQGVIADGVESFKGIVPSRAR